jgi:hypothetical protein
MPATPSPTPASTRPRAACCSAPATRRAPSSKFWTPCPTACILLDAHFRLLLANPLALDQLPVLTTATIGERLRSLGGVPLGKLLEKPPPGRSGHEIIVREPRRRVFEINAQPMLTGPQAGGWVLVIDEITTEREQQDYLQARTASPPSASSPPASPTTSTTSWPSSSSTPRPSS